MKQYKRLTNNNRNEYDPEYDFCCDCKYCGEPKYGEKKDLEVIIAHNNYKEIINGVYITRNRKHENTGFRFVIAGNKYAYHYNYSEKGWADCVTKIKSILLFYRKCINIILKEK